MLSESGKMRKVQIDKLQLPDRLRILCRLYQESPPISALQLSASPDLPGPMFPARPTVCILVI